MMRRILMAGFVLTFAFLSAFALAWGHDEEDGVVHVNRIGASEDFEASEWGGGNPDFDYTPGSPDPFGGTGATVIVNADPPVAYSYIMAQPLIGLTCKYVVISAYVQNVSVPSGTYSVLSLFSPNVPQYDAYQKITWRNPFPTADTGPLTADDGGIIDVGGGWYRIYCVIDVEAHEVSGGRMWFPRFMVEQKGTPGVGDGVMMFGFQIEPGRRYPGPYRRVP